MEIAAKPIEQEIARAKKWSSSAPDWDLALELDTYKQSRDSVQRQIGLLPIASDHAIYDNLVSRNSINQRWIEIIELEIMRRRHR
jgi:hypothetical protein